MKSGENVNLSLKLHNLPLNSSLDIDLNKGSTIDATAAQRTGLCTDMCCERERLTRECQRLFNPYEFDSDTRAVRSFQFTVIFLELIIHFSPS